MSDFIPFQAWLPFGADPANAVTIRANYAASAQTNGVIVAGVSGTRYVVTRCSALADNANAADTQVRIGFAASTTPTTTGVVLSHPGIAPGSGVVEGNGSGTLGYGADGDAILITSESASASIDVVLTYIPVT